MSLTGGSWTVARVRELRERLGIGAIDPAAVRIQTIGVDETARRLKICVGLVLRLVRSSGLPATQLMPSAQWQVPVEALDADAVMIGVPGVIARRPNNFSVSQDMKSLQLPGL